MCVESVIYCDGCHVCRSAQLWKTTSKCVWAASECRVLGSVVSERGIAPDPEKTAAITRLPVPRDIADGASRSSGSAHILSANPTTFNQIHERLEQQWTLALPRDNCCFEVARDILQYLITADGTVRERTAADNAPAS